MKRFDCYLKSIFILLFFQNNQAMFLFVATKKKCSQFLQRSLGGGGGGRNDTKLSYFEEKMSKFAIGLDYRFYQVNKLKQESLKVCTLPCIM
jgi:hypothetical protein